MRLVARLGGRQPQVGLGSAPGSAVAIPVTWAVVAVVAVRARVRVASMVPLCLVLGVTVQRGRESLQGSQVGALW